MMLRVLVRLPPTVVSGSVASWCGFPELLRARVSAGPGPGRLLVSVTSELTLVEASERMMTCCVASCQCFADQRARC